MAAAGLQTTLGSRSRRKPRQLLYKLHNKTMQLQVTWVNELHLLSLHCFLTRNQLVQFVVKPWQPWLVLKGKVFHLLPVVHFDICALVMTLYCDINVARMWHCTLLQPREAECAIWVPNGLLQSSP